MKLIVRAADYAMTDSITDGCLKAIRDGILTDVGLMTNNAEHAQRAVREVQKYPHVSIGQDLNLVSGIPASDPRLIPRLVDEKGQFLSSSFRKKQNQFDIPYSEIIQEMKAQVDRFIEWVGRKPVYITGHSLATPEVLRGMEEICEMYGIFYDCFSQPDLPTGNRWYYKHQKVDPNDRKPVFTLQDQANTDVVAHIINGELNLDPEHQEFALLATHCGYCDGELLNMSTFSVIRGREIEALCSPQVREWIEKNSIELINFQDYLDQRHSNERIRSTPGIPY